MKCFNERGLPSLVKILSVDFEIRYMDRIDGNAHRIFGRCDCNTQVIFIDESLKSQHLAETLLHEIVHGINWVMGLNDESTEEEFTARSVTGLCAFWRDNVSVMGWIQHQITVAGNYTPVSQLTENKTP